MKRNMNVRFSDLSGGLFAGTGKADVGEGADKFQKAAEIKWHGRICSIRIPGFRNQ